MRDINNMNAQDMCMDWNDAIESDGTDFTPLPPGVYEFEVTDFERERHPGSENLPPCYKAALILTAFGEEGRTSRIFCDLFLHRKMEWKLAEFFRSIGQKRHGERFVPDWNTITGKRGRALIKITEYTDRYGSIRTRNEIEKFIDYDETEMKTPMPGVSAKDHADTGFTDSFAGSEADIPF